MRIRGFRIPDSRFRIPGSFPFGNPESRIGNPDGVAAEGRVESSSVGSPARAPDSFPDSRIDSPSGIRNRESGIPMGLRPQAASESSSVGSLRHARIRGFRIPDSRFSIPESFPFGNPESRIGNPDGVAAAGRVRVFLRRLAAPSRTSGDSEFRIRDSRYRNHSPSGIRNRESGIPMGLRPQAASESSSVGSLRHAAPLGIPNSGFEILDTGIIPLRESGIANRESRWGCGRRPR